MAERIADKMALEAGLTGVRFTSAGTSDDDIGHPIDARAVTELRAGGYRTTNHRAHQITAQEIRDADLVVAMEDVHVEKMRDLVPDANNIRLLTDFDPEARPGSGIPDPWYGKPAAFAATKTQLERAIPGVLDWVRAHAAA